MGGASSKEEEDYERDLITRNPMEELMLLNHSSKCAIHKVAVFSGNYIVTAGEDGSLYTWHIHTGTKVASYNEDGNGVEISTIERANDNTVVVGYHNGIVTIYDIFTYHVTGEIEFHQGAPIRNITFVKGKDRLQCLILGGRRTLTMHYLNGDMIGQVTLEDEQVHLMLAYESNLLITGGKTSFLYLYSLSKMSFSKMLGQHKEPISALHRINDKLFASGSMDGVVSLWGTSKMRTLRHFNISESNGGPVHDVCLIEDHFIGVAFGRSFRVFEIISGNCICAMSNVHATDIRHFISLYHGTCFVTCANDGKLKLWRAPPGMTNALSKKASMKDSPRGSHANIWSNLSNSSSSYGRMQPSKPKHEASDTSKAIYLGELYCHTGNVLKIVPLSQYAFVSIGEDGYIGIWKDKRTQQETRNILASGILRNDVKRMHQAHHRMVGYWQGHGPKNGRMQDTAEKPSSEDHVEVPDTMDKMPDLVHYTPVSSSLSSLVSNEVISSAEIDFNLDVL